MEHRAKPMKKNIVPDLVMDGFSLATELEAWLNVTNAPISSEAVSAFAV
jgi:hypothetical protein